MNNAPAILKTIIIYAVCVPLAIIVGYFITNPMDYSTLGLFGIVALLLVSPLLLRWHYPLLLFSWSSSITVFFLMGAPNLWLVMVMLSLGISVLERTLSGQMQFIRVPQITWPLIVMIAVALVTAEATGGVGLRVFGSEVYGGRKYIYLLIGIMSYFALTARRIPPEKAGLYVALFFLGQATKAIGDLFAIAPSWMHFVFWVFPPSSNSSDPFEVGVTRLGGVSAAASGMMLWMMARYGLRGILLSGKLWRPFLFVALFALVFLGGYRTSLFGIMLAFIMMFFMEGLHRTRLLPTFVLFGVLATTALIPLANKLPFTFQRTLAFLPLDLDQAAKQSAEDSTDWRLNMWSAMLPQVPQYLLLGKGLAISKEEYNEMMGGSLVAIGAGQFDPGQNSLALSYDYHNGMLSIVMGFGIWGLIAFLWFVFAGLRVTYLNFKHGDPALRTVNALLFILFLTQAGSYLSCMGGLSLATDIGYFLGFLGLSIALNNGVCQPAPRPAQADQPVTPAEPYSRLRPGFQR
jgi:O-Antigen ligase